MSAHRRSFFIIMPLNKQQKEKVVDDLRQKVDKQKSMVFVSLDKIKTKDIEQIKKDLKKEEAQLSVFKKTLMNIVFTEKKINIDWDKMETKTALAFAFEDETAPAKILADYGKKNEDLKIMGGVLENRFLSADEMMVLAKLPNKDAMRAKLVGTIQAPISGFVQVLSGNIKGLIYALKAIK
jgi:large subunit ribosomal protein L10